MHNLLVVVILISVSCSTFFVAAEKSPPRWLKGAPIIETTLPPFSNATFTHAILRMSGLGWSYATIDGQRLDETRRLDPGWSLTKGLSSFALASTFDITSTLSNKNNNGKKTLRVHLAGGHYTRNWYEGNGDTVLFLEVLYYSSSSSVSIVRSTAQAASFRCLSPDSSPVRAASVYGGEVFDARLNDERAWKWLPCEQVDNSSSVSNDIVDQAFEPVRMHPPLEAIDNWTVSAAAGNSTSGSSQEEAETTRFFDFGQNTAAVLRVTMSAASCPAGTRVVLQHAELIWPTNRTLNRINLGMANATDVYFTAAPPSASSSIIEWQPEFTYHGFRYASVQASRCIKLLRVVSVPIHSDVQRNSHFSTSHPLLQKLHNAVIQGQLSNLISIPVDCPQRDERLGWLADASLTAEEANLNFKMGAFYSAFTQQLTNALRYPPGMDAVPDFVPACDPENGVMEIKCNRPYTRPGDPSWAAALLVIPFETYKRTGDTKILSDNYASFVAFVTKLQQRASMSGGLLTYGDFGDWESLSKVDTALVSSYQLFQFETIMSRIAAVLHLPADEVAQWSRAANKTRDSFNAAFFNETTCTYAGGARHRDAHTGLSPGMQSANALPLYAGIVPEQYRSCVASTLAKFVREGDLCRVAGSERCWKGHLSVGIVGAQALLPALWENGQKEMALRLLHTETFPSWLFMIQSGATTLWERWQDTFLPAEGASHNHIMFGSVDPFLYSAIGGVRNDAFVTEVDCRFVCLALCGRRGGGGGGGAHSQRKCHDVNVSVNVGQKSVVSVQHRFDQQRSVIVSTVRNTMRVLIAEEDAVIIEKVGKDIVVVTKC